MADSPGTRGDRTPSPSVATLPPSGTETSKPKSAAANEPLKGSAAKSSDAAAAGKAARDLEQHDPDERRRRIAETAYYRAERRGFAPGREEDDWLEAEQEIDRGTPTSKKPEENDFPSPK